MQKQMIRFDSNRKYEIILQDAWGYLVVSELRDIIYC